MSAFALVISLHLLGYPPPPIYYVVKGSELLPVNPSSFCNNVGPVEGNNQSLQQETNKLTMQGFLMTKPGMLLTHASQFLQLLLAHLNKAFVCF